MEPVSDYHLDLKNIFNPTWFEKVGQQEMGFQSCLSFTKWKGRNFVGFVEFSFFPLTYMQKK